MTRRDVSHDVRVCATEDDVAMQAAAWLADVLERQVRSTGRASLVLAGGSTPKPVYRQLGSAFREGVSWPAVHAFWGDERYVPHTDSRSNYRVAQEALLASVPIQAGHVHPMPTHWPDAATAAAEYETTVETYFAGSSPVFDVVLLGIGEDGHVASVFSDSPAISSAHMAMAVTVPADPPIRLTLTLPMLAGARYVGVVATGARKARALAHAFAGEFDTPAAILARTAPETVWWTDRAAMGTDADGGPR